MVGSKPGFSLLVVVAETTTLRKKMAVPATMQASTCPATTSATYEHSVSRGRLQYACCPPKQRISTSKTAADAKCNIAGQVLLRVRASSICGSDLRVIYGPRDPAQCEVPCDVVCGHEPCGEIVAAGPGCRAFQPGDRVVVYHIVGCGRCSPCRSGYMLMCEEAAMPTASTLHFKAYGWQRDGGHAHYMIGEI